MLGNGSFDFKMATSPTTAEATIADSTTGVGVDSTVGLGEDAVAVAVATAHY